MTAAGFTLTWIALGVTALVLQGWGIATGRGMLTHRIRRLRATLAGELVLLPLWTWLTWHWFLQPEGSGHWVADVAAALGGAVLAVVSYRSARRHVESEAR
jgi:hypothetical protein